MRGVTRAIRSFINWLGPDRSRLLFLLLAFTGLISLMLNAVGQQQQWVRLVQSVLFIAFLTGAVVIIVWRFPQQDRRQLLLVVAPALVAMSLGLLFPDLMMFFLPVAVGWIVISLIAMRGGVRREYQAAIKHLRKAEYKEAIAVMTSLIEQEPKVAEHYRFRAELYRLSSKIKKAREDYQRVVELTPESGVGYNGLAEVYLQDGEYEQALPYAQKSMEMEPDHWVPAYNLGMIEDRRGNWEAVSAPLKQALELGIPDSRHRLLTHLWLARAYYHLGQLEQANAEIKEMQREHDGQREWNTIFESEEATVLKAVLLDDVTLAAKLLEENASVELLANAS
ncbi:MAG: tetratricopeptide repeat protein [Anaerolineae bacterium]|nr:tetratricopeptide repeat protein [Anaerolineae bacterium]